MRNNPIEVALLMLIALAGCRGGGDGNEATAPGSAGGGGAVQTDTLTGLYESGAGPRRNQMCMLDRDNGRTSFGFVTWGDGDTNCSGSGLATREGDRLRLQLDGDASCTVEARIDGKRLTLPDNIPTECGSYYCGAGARMTGVAFDKIGGTPEDALRAVDLVGDPLCGG